MACLEGGLMGEKVELWAPILGAERDFRMVGRDVKTIHFVQVRGAELGEVRCRPVKAARA